MLKGHVSIVGAGILGQTLALDLHHRGYKVTLYERSAPDAWEGASPVAGGMLAPYCELETLEPRIHQWGLIGLERWPHYLRLSASEDALIRTGSLIVSHSQDKGLWEDLRQKILTRSDTSALQIWTSEMLSLEEPELAGRFHQSMFFPAEGLLDVPTLLQQQRHTLRQSPGVQCHFNEPVHNLTALLCNPGTSSFPTPDWVVDTRGIGAANDLPQLRGVRGEAILVYAPDVDLRRTIRVMHPRYPLYIVPRPDRRYFIGATSIEREDDSPITVRSTLELLSAAFTVHPGFAEASVVQTMVGLRPAFPDHLPGLRQSGRLIRANGLYRHGYLLTPVMVEAILSQMGEAAPHHDIPVNIVPEHSKEQPCQT